jgi:hypothetical protein
MTLSNQCTIFIAAILHLLLGALTCLIALIRLLSKSINRCHSFCIVAKRVWIKMHAYCFLPALCYEPVIKFHILPSFYPIKNAWLERCEKRENSLFVLFTENTRHRASMQRSCLWSMSIFYRKISGVKLGLKITFNCVYFTARLNFML